jgi:hypothetical protein
MIEELYLRWVFACLRIIWIKEEICLVFIICRV